MREVQRRRGAQYLVTGHHQDDQIETILLRALRGSAPAGLAGVAQRGRGGLVRPLLPFTRRELLEYATARGLPIHDDAASRDPRHLRSWVRATLLPLLDARLGPRLKTDMLAMGRHFASDRRAWDRVLDLLPGLALEVQDGAFAVARAVLCGYDNELSVALLRAAARRAGLVLGPARARRLLALAQRPSGRGAPLGEGWSAEVAFDRLRVSRNDSEIGCALERILPAGERGSALFGEYEIARSNRSGAGAGDQAISYSPNSALPRSPAGKMRSSAQPISLSLRLTRSRSNATSADQPSPRGAPRPDGRCANAKSRRARAGPRTSPARRAAARNSATDNSLS